MPSFQKTTYGKDNSKTIFIFGNREQLHIHLWFLGKFLAAHNYKAIVYTFSKTLLSSDAEQTQKNFEEIKQDVIKTVHTLSKREQKNLSVFGISLGVSLSFMVANDIPSITKIIILMPCADLAETVWSSENRWRELKTTLTKRKYTLKKLKDSWFDLAPINNVDRLTGKKILLYAAEKDAVIPFSQTKKLVQALNDHDIDYRSIINTKHNHFLSVTISLLKFETYMRFLNEKSR